MTALHSAAVQCGTNFPLLGNYVCYIEQTAPCAVLHSQGNDDHEQDDDILFIRCVHESIQS